MGKLKGQVQYGKFENGGKLTRREAMLAKCYECNGYDESGVDCEIQACPMYAYHPNRGKKRAVLP